MVLTLAGAIAEMVTIGAVIPILLSAANTVHRDRFAIAWDAVSKTGSILNISSIASAALLLSIAALCSAIIRLVLNKKTQQFVYGIHQDIVLRIFSNTLRQPFSWHALQNSSMLLAAVEKVHLVCAALLSPVVSAVSAGGMAAIIALFLFSINPMAATIAIATVSLVYLITILMTRSTSQLAAKAEAHLRPVRFQILQESLGGIRDIILDQAQSTFEQRMAQIENQYGQVLAQSASLNQKPRLIVEAAILILIAALGLWFDAQPGGIAGSIPMLGALALGAQRLLPLIQLVYHGYANYSFHRPSLDDVVAFLRLPMVLSPESIDLEPHRFENEIRLHNVSYHYDGPRDTLQNVSLVIRKGERVGIVGRTGSGKTTLIDLISGLRKVSDGSILIDGVPLSYVSDRDWFAQIAYVPQSIFLSDDSIAANIAFGRYTDPIDLERVATVARQAGLSDFLAQLPDGLATCVGERGVRLSGGERQRIGIARALYKNATVLIFDEATSALDDQTEEMIIDSIEQIGSDLTIIIVTHRISTVAICDRVFRIEDGRITEADDLLRPIVKKGLIGNMSESISSGAVQGRASLRP